MRYRGKETNRVKPANNVPAVLKLLPNHEGRQDCKHQGGQGLGLNGMASKCEFSKASSAEKEPKMLTGSTRNKGMWQWHGNFRFSRRGQ